MQHHDDDGLRNRPLHELLNEDEDIERPYQPDNSFGNFNLEYNTSNQDTRKNYSQFLRMCAIGIAIIVVVGGAVAMISLAPARRYGSIDSSTQQQQQQVILGDSPDTQSIKHEATVENLSKGAVSSDHAICSSLGNHILNYKGGNVVDAAVATAICLGVVNPSSSGIGGGAFILIHIDPNANNNNANANNNNNSMMRNRRPVPPIIDARDPSVEEMVNGKILTVVDARETAPESSSETMFEGLPGHVSTVGGLAIAVPGEIRGLEYAHAKYGSLSWRQVLDPSIRLAREGCPVSHYLASAIQHHVQERWGFMPLRNLLSKNGGGGDPLEEHDIMRNPSLGATLEAIAEQGSDALYDGPRTKQFVEDVRANGGILTENDMRRYRPTLRTPLVAKNVAGYTLVGVPPPSSGGATLMGAARFLAGYRANGRIPPSHHRLVEAMKHAFAIRMSLSDPDYNTARVQDAVNDLVSTNYIDELRRNTSDTDTLPLSLYGGPKWAQLQDVPDKRPKLSEFDADDESERRRHLNEQEEHRVLSRFGYLNDKGTTHLSVMDIHGNAVAITSSLNTYFGSGIISESTGILLNSQMDDFATPGRPNYFGVSPSEANYIHPGKKPLSSMAPTMVFQRTGTNPFGELLMVLGASGGPKIISSVLQVFWNYAVMDQTLFDAIHAPRIHDQLLHHDRVATLYEQANIKGHALQVSESARLELQERGHTLVPIGYSGCVQAVAMHKFKREIVAVADARKGGKPAGA